MKRDAPVLGLTDTPREVFLALVEDFRQKGQDAIYSLYGQSWPSLKEQEAQKLQELHDHCDSWVECYDAAVAREK